MRCNPAALRLSPLVAALSLASTAVLAVPAPAAPASSPYHTDAQNSFVEDATSRGVNQVNMITCIMNAMRPDAMVNLGNYIALVDKNKCDTEGRSDAGNAASTGAGNTAPAYMTATLNSVRASNDEPMRAKAWINESDGGFDALIYVNISASEAPSDSNPYGVFRLDFCVKGGNTGPCINQGYLEGSDGGISYFENESDGGQLRSKALRLSTSAGGESGSGALEMEENGTPVAFQFAYNGDYFRRKSGAQDQCFSRDASDADTAMSVWRYGLYSPETGERVTRNSGFPVEFTHGGQTYRGHMGYWGLGMPAEAASLMSTGSIVTRVEYLNGQEPLRTNYNLTKAGGRLVKYTKQTRTLAGIDKIRFNTFVWDTAGFFSGAQANQQYEMYWDNANGVFKVTGVIECNSRCENRSFASEETVAASYFANKGGARGWSQALGGELYIALEGVNGTPDPAQIGVIYRLQDLVYPADMPATLHCLRDCPTAATLGDFFAPSSAAASPFVTTSFNRWGPTTDVVTYTANGSDALLYDGTTTAVTFTDAEAMQQRPQYQHGVRTGRLFASLPAAECDGNASQYCEQKIEQLDVYYQWETGANAWNQFAALRATLGGAFVQFEAPLQVTYNVPSGAQYGPYAGTEIVLQYGGFGDLWGIPGHCVSRVTNDPVSCETQDSRYVPAFVIPFSESLGRVLNGNSPLLAKWLDREIRFARKPLQTCIDNGLSLGAAPALPTSADLADPSDASSPVGIGAQPSVSAAPRVIHGDVKY